MSRPLSPLPRGSVGYHTRYETAEICPHCCPSPDTISYHTERERSIVLKGGGGGGEGRGKRRKLEKERGKVEKEMRKVDKEMRKVEKERRKVEKERRKVKKEKGKGIGRKVER